MNAEEYQLAVQLFLKACDLPPGERSAILAEADRVELRSLVERMLEEEERVDDETTLSDPMVALGRVPLLGEPRTESDSGPTDGMLTDCRRYRIDGEIARGGVGAILKGRDLELGRDIAIKVLLDSNRENPEAVQRLINEAQIGGQLQHPGIAPVYELGQFADKRLFVAMKLVKGQTLARVLAERSDSLEERSRLLAEFRQVCQAVAYAHSRGVIHRDLKPDNIMIGRFGEVQVMDWGLAKVLSRSEHDRSNQESVSTETISVIKTLRTPDEKQDDSAETRVGSVMGTLAYMATEQAMGEIQKIDERADVFGLGAILCQIITGKPPYVEEDGSELLRSAIAGRLDACFERLDTCGADTELVQLTKECLAPDRKSRLRHAGIVADRITAYLESVDDRVRQAELNEAQQKVRTQQAERVAEAAEARSRAEQRARRLQLVSGAVLLVTFVASAGWITVLQNRHIREMQQRQLALVEAQVDALLSAVPDSVPFAIASLKPSRSDVLEKLLALFQDESLDTVQRLHIAFALADLGHRSEHLAEFLIGSITDVAAAESENFVSAVRHLGESARSRIADATNEVEEKKDWHLKARLAVLELHLGRAGLASEMLQYEQRSDRSQRTIFIESFSAWPGDLLELSGQDWRDEDDSALLSGVCLAVGGMNGLSQSEQQNWREIIADWYTDQPHAVTHSAAGWALRAWNVATPSVPTSTVDRQPRDWMVTPAGLTMVRIPAGELVRESPGGNQQTVQISRDFLLSDREVTVRQFKQFMTDTRYNGPRPENWPGVREEVSVTPDHPVQQVSWYDAVMFCNWLTGREGLEPCYVPDDDSHRNHPSVWRRVDADGYHLPSEAQWEYACRAGTTTSYEFGNDEGPLLDYAVYFMNSKSHASVGGSKFCSAWGLFDMHGNVREWCGDWKGDYGDAAVVTDPAGPADGTHRIHRGGSWNANSENCKASNRFGTEPQVRDDYLGFRVARSAIGR